ncbi:AAA family ATPase [Bacillus subtilis]
MIIGTFINGYKSYAKSIFAPIANNNDQKYAVYIGANGVGKSGILEALDVFFNGREWNATRGSTREDRYITPIFFIEKKRFLTFLFNSHRYSKSDIDVNRKLLNDLNNISSQFWNGIQDSLKGAARREYINTFYTFLSTLTKDTDQEEYLILPSGTKFNGKPTLAPFDSHFKNLLGDKEYEKKIDRLRKLLRDYYAYVYIPVEQSADEILKIEDRQMQTLMNKDVLNEIDNVLTTKYEIEGRNKSFLSFINDYLNTFMENINESIQLIDKQYNYSPEANSKRNLTVTDIREKVLEAYFSKRPLRYKNREVNKLSSGEQRKALIDISYAFLSNVKEMDREIILAIDEPEVSMNVINCFPQFERLEQLSKVYNRQVLITTHWYGSLPITNSGHLFHLHKEIEGDVCISNFSFFDYLDEQRRFPNDIGLKSMFDLATSIISYSKFANNTNWIICEGSTDKLYLEEILRDNGNFKVLPVGGCANVIKLYGLLSYPLADKTTANAMNGKILCLIDTDSKRMEITKAPEGNGRIDIRRLQTLTSNNIQSVRLLEPWKQGQYYEKTVIEDCLNPKVYYNVIKEIINSDANMTIQQLFSMYRFNENTRFSRVLDESSSFLIPMNIEAAQNKIKIAEFLADKKIKTKVALLYNEKCKEMQSSDNLLSDAICKYFNITDRINEEVLT